MKVADVVPLGTVAVTLKLPAVRPATAVMAVVPDASVVPVAAASVAVAPLAGAENVTTASGTRLPPASVT